MTSAPGLTQAEAATRLATLGANVITPRRRVPLTARLGNQLRDPLLIVLICGAALTLAIGHLTDATVIIVVIVVNVTVGVVQEIRADRAITALHALSAPRARVVRDTVEIEIPAAEVVPGDLLVLGEGDLIAADGELVDAAALLVDESTLTGEAVPVDKSPMAAEPAGRLVSAGTVVVRGRGQVLATATGQASATGRLATMLATAPPITPLQRRLRALSRILAALAVGLCLVVGVLGLLRGQPWVDVIVTAISLMVAAVPESLPTVVVLSLALGASRMAAHRAIVRRLPAVETLGSVSVIATDKTGTLTEGRMAVQQLWTPTAPTVATCTGTGYEPRGAVWRNGREVTVDEAGDLATLLHAAALCSDAKLDPPTADRPSWEVLGDPTEGALLVAAGKLGLDVAGQSAEGPRVTEFPFDSARKRMSVVHRAGSGYVVLTKGAPELLLSPAMMAEDPSVLERAAHAAHDLAAEGLRVLAVASRTLPRRPADAGEAEGDLRLLGLIAIADPPKASAHHTLTTVRAAGIELMLITGDHRATARRIATDVGLADETTEVVDARSATDPDILARSTVVARATPEQKLGIIEARQRAGQVVAMVGDGVNDGPALRRADIGVAMGRRGTEVARQAADLVLADDELATLVTAVGEGRRIYANIRRFLLFGMSGGAAEILVMLVGPFLGLPIPLLPAQILWINLLTHGLTGVSLGAEPAEAGALTQPPRPPTQSVLGDRLWQRILRIAVLLAAVSLVAGWWALYRGAPWQTMIFLTLGFSQLGVALALRARPRSWSNPFLVVAVAAAALLQLAGVYVPFLASILGTAPLAPADLAVAGGLSLAGYVGIHLDRRLHPR